MMATILENIQLAFAVCRIGIYSLFCRLCCTPTLQKPEFSLICLGLTKAGKTTLLSLLAKESLDDIEPTPGFLIKAIQLKDCIVNVKEIGGGEKVRAYWRHYYKGSQAVIFVVDAASVEHDWETTRQLFADAVAHPSLRSLPWLVLANCQDKPDARSDEVVRRDLNIDSLPPERCVVYMSSMYQVPQLVSTVEKFASQLITDSQLPLKVRDKAS